MTLAMARNEPNRWTHPLSWPRPDWATKTHWTGESLIHEADATQPVRVDSDVTGHAGHRNLTLRMATADVVEFADSGSARVEREEPLIFVQLDGDHTIACLDPEDARQLGENLLSLYRAATNDTQGRKAA